MLNLLDLYDTEVRGSLAAPAPGYRAERDGPVVRLVGQSPDTNDNAVVLARLTEADADREIARQIDFFGALGHAFEWKHFSHDQPASLPDKLRTAGFEAQESETLVVLDASHDFADADIEYGIRIEELKEPATLEAIGVVNTAVYGNPRHSEWLVASIAKEKQSAPDAIRIYAAVAGELPVSVGWVRHRPGETFGSLWGGSTLPEWRGKGIYSALVALRARAAHQQGCRWLTVDCSPMSLPILERRGFQRLSTTTPYVWSPKV
jgi:GNAT superfamily N-acetyltransferase